jgi:hypothetical protein
LTLIALIRPLQLCADGGYQLRLGVLGVPLIMVPDSMILCFIFMSVSGFSTMVEGLELGLVKTIEVGMFHH